MSELVAWMIVLGLAVTIACIVMLSWQLESHARSTAEMMFHSNEMLLAQLERLTNPSLQAPEPAVGVVLESSGAQLAEPLTQVNGRLVAAEAGELPRRRIEELLSAG